MDLLTILKPSLVTLKPFLLDFWWLIAIALVLPVFKASWFKGVFGEFLVRVSARLLLDKNQYHAFHNVMLATPDGTTQIDHIFVSEFGVFVVENQKHERLDFRRPFASDLDTASF